MCERTLWNNTSTANCESYSTVDGRATTVRPACCQYFYFLFYSFVGDEAHTEKYCISSGRSCQMDGALIHPSPCWAVARQRNIVCACALYRHLGKGAGHISQAWLCVFLFLGVFDVREIDSAYVCATVNGEQKGDTRTDETTRQSKVSL